MAKVQSELTNISNNKLLKYLCSFLNKILKKDVFT